MPQTMVQAIGHLCQFWSRSMSPYGVTRLQWVNRSVSGNSNRWIHFFFGELISFILIFYIMIYVWHLSEGNISRKLNCHKTFVFTRACIKRFKLIIIIHQLISRWTQFQRPFLLSQNNYCKASTVPWAQLESALGISVMLINQHDD